MRDIAANHSRRITDQSRCPRTATVATAERAAIEDADDGLGVGLGSGLGLGLGLGLGVGLGSGTPGNNGWGTPGNGDSLSSAGPSSAYVQVDPSAHLHLLKSSPVVRFPKLLSGQVTGLPLMRMPAPEKDTLSPKDAGTEHAARSKTINTLEFIILS